MWPHRCHLLFIPLLLLLSAPQTAGKKKSPAAKPAVPTSGELNTKDGHSCTWEVAGTEGPVTLKLSCSAQGEEPGRAYECQFTGQPDLCPPYKDKATQYWKQVVGKLRKRNDACEGEKVLKTRLCKKGPAQSHMRLAERSGEEKTEAVAPTLMGKEAGEGEKEPLLEDMMMNDGNAGDAESVNFCADGSLQVCSFFAKFFG
ncbi:fibroblast growth factor-binding protein 2 [Denticeps clupeoides]|uniref:Uncharacterized protein n=1 Tax=Denticeps clupeoides TaxID=299321 RepID=A0AAY4C2P4_9TELE|nr:fibroblast growth factor-binding protein 2-like [Denticeps clupeoides]